MNISLQTQSQDINPQKPDPLIQTSSTPIHLLPPSFLKSYRDFTFKHQSSYYRIYEATSLHNGKPYSIRVLDLESAFYLKNRNLAITLFMQELFYLSLRFGSLDLIEFSAFEVFEDRIAFVMKPCANLKEIQHEHQQKNVSETVDLEKLINELYNDVCLINSKFGIANIDIIMDNIFEVKESSSFFISDWLTGTRNEIIFSTDEIPDETISIFEKTISWLNQEPKDRRYAAPEQITSKFKEKKADTLAEIYVLAIFALEFLGVDYNDLESLVLETNENSYAIKLELITDRLVNQKLLTSSSKVLLKAMLMRDSSRRREAFQLLQKSTANSPLKYSPLRKSISPEGKFYKEEYNTMGNVKEKSSQKFEIPTFTKAKTLLEKDEAMEENRPSVKEAKSRESLSMPAMKLLEKTNEISFEILRKEHIDVSDAIAHASLNIESIILRQAGIGALEAKSISEGVWPNLQMLDLAGNNLGNKGVEYIAQNKIWANLQTLNLSDNSIDGKGVRVLAENGVWTQLRILCLRHNYIDYDGVSHLARNRSWVSLQTLDLAENYIGSEGAKALANNESWAHLQYLTLLRNGVEESAIKYLKEVARWGKQASISY